MRICKSNGGLRKPFLKKMIWALNELKQGNIPREKFGICYNVYYLIDDYCSYEINKESQDWDKYSGNDEYPIPSPNKRKTAENAFFDIEIEKWTGEYGKLRLELVDFLITKFEGYLHAQ